MTRGGVEGEASVVHYFVDEAGNPPLFHRKGRLIIGNDGCSRFFMLGKLEIDEPDALVRQLLELRQELPADPYFKAVPSMQPQNRKTALSLHAKHDIPKVRRKVYRLLLKANLR